MTAYINNSSSTTSYTIPFPTSSVQQSGISYYDHTVGYPKTTLLVENIIITFELKDKMKTSLSFKDYMKFVIIHHKLPDDCKNLEELGKLIEEMKMVSEL